MSSIRPVLVLTPATRFGSWAWIEKVLAADPSRPVIVVGYGRSETASANVRFATLPPLIDYGAWGPRLAERRFLALNLLYYAPLVPIAWWIILRHRPRVLLANGVNSAAILGLLAGKHRRLLLAFHGSIGHAGQRWHGILRRVLGRVDRAFVNSEGSADDLAHVLPRERIQVIEHWADPVFFRVPVERGRHDVLRVLFVGRLDVEKFDQCLRVCKRLGEERVIQLDAVGTGPLQAGLRGPGLNHVGYVGDQRRLAELYAAADVVWAPADVTYVSIPGVEGLASGCPLIISATPAVFTHAEQGLKVPIDIVPPEVGRVVDEDGDAERTLREWAKAGIELETRRRCRAYAERRHSDRNIEPLAREFVGQQ